jgi:hypothetical protein
VRALRPTDKTLNLTRSARAGNKNRNCTGTLFISMCVCAARVGSVYRELMSDAISASDGRRVYAACSRRAAVGKQIRSKLGRRRFLEIARRNRVFSPTAPGLLQIKRHGKNLLHGLIDAGSGLTPTIWSL